MAALPAGCRAGACGFACDGGSPHRLKGSSPVACGAEGSDEAAAAEAVCWCCAMLMPPKGSSLTADANPPTGQSHNKPHRRHRRSATKQNLAG